MLICPKISGVTIESIETLREHAMELIIKEITDDWNEEEREHGQGGHQVLSQAANHHRPSRPNGMMDQDHPEGPEADAQPVHEAGEVGRVEVVG